MRHFLIALFATLMLSTTVFAGELNVTEAPDCEVQTIVFETPKTVDDGWFPLEEVAKYLPIDVTRDSKNTKFIIDSKPMAETWRSLAHQEIFFSSLKWRTKDFKMVDDVLYCSPWFLATRLGGVGFVHDNSLWYCKTTLDINGHIDAALLELKVVAPEEYALITKYLTGGVMAAKEKMGSDVLAYTYPNAAKPVCYINNLKLTGATLASNIAHEAWHAYQAKNGMAVNEQGAEIYEAKVLNLLLREQRVYNGTIHLYE